MVGVDLCDLFNRFDMTVLVSLDSDCWWAFVWLDGLPTLITNRIGGKQCQYASTTKQCQYASTTNNKTLLQIECVLLSNRESKKGLIIDDVFYGGMTPRDIVFTVTVWLG